MMSSGTQRNDAVGPVLVTGGSGKLAGLVIEWLLQNTQLRVVTTTRHPDQLGAFARRGVEVRYADHELPDSLRQAFRGVARMLVISSYSIGSRAEQMRHVIKAAEAAGVGHICYTSGAGARPVQDPVTADHFWSELAIMSSGLSWTMLRHNMFAQHVPLTLALAAASGVLHSPIGTQGRGYVTREDCARADAGALASASTECRIVDVTGPAVVTHAQLAQCASRIIGRPIAFQAVSKDQAVQTWVAQGIPPFVANLLGDFDLFAGEGHHAVATSAVRDLGGREPEAIESYLARTAALLLPDASGRTRIDVLLQA